MIECFGCNAVRSFWSTYGMQVTISAANIWVTTFVVIMQMEVSVAIRWYFQQYIYAPDCFYSIVIYAGVLGKSFFYSYVGDSFK